MRWHRHLCDLGKFYERCGILVLIMIKVNTLSQMFFRCHSVWI